MENVREFKHSNVEEVNKVYKTYDYNLFVDMEGNRCINIKHLNNIKVSLNKKQLPIPIIVKLTAEGNLEIFEGQHRFRALVELEKPIYYMIVEDLTLEDAITINSISRKWTMEDYHEHYLALGKPEYKRLQFFMDSTGLTLHTARFFAAGYNISNRVTYANFIAGSFVFDNYETTMELFNQHLDYQPCPAFSRVIFKQSLIKVIHHPQYDHNRMVSKLETNAYRVTPRNNITEYVDLLTEIYNQNQPKHTKVYFNIDL